MELLERLKESSQGKNPLPWSISGRIVYVVSHSYPYSSNGYAVRTHGIASALVKQGYSVVVINRPGRPWDLSGFSREVEETNKTIDGVRYLFFRSPSTKVLEKEDYLQSVAELLKEAMKVFKPTVVIAASDWENALPAAVAAREFGIQFYYEVRGFWELTRVAKNPEYSDSESYKVHVDRENKVAEAADKVITINRFMVDELVSRRVKKDKIHIVPNGYSEIPDFTKKPRFTKNDLGIETQYVVGYIGSFNEYEGLSDLVLACASLREEGVDISLLLVGSSSPFNEVKNKRENDIALKYKKIAKEENFSDYLYLPGRVDIEDLFEYYSMIDLVVIPRRADRVSKVVSPLKPYEALAHGKKLLVSDVPPLKEISNTVPSVRSFISENVSNLKKNILKMLSIEAKDQISLQKEVINYCNNWQSSIDKIFNKIKLNKYIYYVSGNKYIENLRYSSVVKKAHTLYKVSEELEESKKEKDLKIYDSLSKFKLAAIMDEFTIECFKYEVELTTFTPDNWFDTLEQERVDLLFVESCWFGNGNTWGALLKDKNPEGFNALTELINYCNNKKIPTIFWNKEDPPHYKIFAPTAQLFDFVFTSDINMVPYYKKDYDKDVFPMSFFCQPKIHNPIERTTRKNKAAFAGSYYNQKPERCRDFNIVIDSLIQSGVDYEIFDRCYHRQTKAFEFPEKYKEKIIGFLDVEEMWKAYKGYKYQINLNSVKNSSTMFARRVYESLASGTPVISNYSKGVIEKFKDIVICSDNVRQLSSAINELEQDESKYQDIVIKGIRETLSKHTLEERLLDMIGIIYGDYLNRKIKKYVTIFAHVDNENDIKKVLDFYKKQSYRKKRLFILLGNVVDCNAYLNSSTFEIQYVNLKFYTSRKYGYKEIDSSSKYYFILNSKRNYDETLIQDEVNELKYINLMDYKNKKVRLFMEEELSKLKME